LAVLLLRLTRRLFKGCRQKPRAAVGYRCRERLPAAVNPHNNGEKRMKINKLDHICIAVKNLEAARKIWEPVLGKSKPDDEYIDEPEKIKVARYWVGEVVFELM
jgi:hypothetical protein